MEPQSVLRELLTLHATYAKKIEMAKDDYIGGLRQLVEAQMKGAAVAAESEVEAKP